LKLRKSTILISLVALVFGLAAMIFTLYPAVKEVGSRKSSPDFSIRNSIFPYLQDFKKHLESVQEFSSILKELEKEKAGAWLMSMENGEKRFICPYTDTYNKLRTLLLVETGSSGTRMVATTKYFGNDVTRSEVVEYGSFYLDYVPSYSLVMESDYQRYLQEGYTFNKVYNANAFSLGRFVSDVFQGMGPVIILKEGASLSERFFEIIERYLIPFMPVRYFLRKS